tara:strand:- start:122 stop:799 length:678 start_codon:yes stop_codon:yes gene_type:complete
MQKIIVAIDGFASTGKSSHAKRLAKNLDYIYIDTGAMYRAVTYFAIQKCNYNSINKKQLISSLENIKIHFENNSSDQKTFLNDINVSKEIRQIDVNSRVSNVAQIKEVREFLVRHQQALGEKKGIIMDGRDIGTVVFPNAECKFFLTATSKVRAKRRHIEQLKKGYNESYESVLAGINKRDKLDITRKSSPLIKSEEALEIDVSELSLDEVYEIIWGYVSKKLIK